MARARGGGAIGLKIVKRLGAPAFHPMRQVTSAAMKVQSR